MKTELRILILEDVPEDAELITRKLSKAKLQFTARTVDNKKDFLKELKEFSPDVILSDYSMPGFTGLEALEMMKEIAPSTPFIIITGSINEETAVECMKAGAVDYVLKDRLIRIGPAVEAAFENKRVRDEKARVEKALVASAREWKTTFDAINDAVCLLDMNGNVLRCNTAMKNLVGKPFCEIIGKGCSGLFRNAASPDNLCLFVRMHESLHRETMRVELNDRWLDILVDPILDETGALIGGVQIISDVTERKWAAEALQESERLLKDAQRLGRIGHWEYDLKTRQISWSDMVFTLYERDPKLGPPTEEEEAAYYSPEDAGRLRNFAERAIKTGEPWEVDISVRLPGERLMNCVSIGKSIKDDRGQVIKLYGTIQDITERKRADKALKFTRFSLDNAADSMVNTGIDGRFIDVNDAFCRSVGYSREELLSMSVHDIDLNLPAEIWPEFWEKLKQSGSLTFESRHRTKEGKVFPVEITASFFEYNGKEYHCGFARDITERKRAEEALRESEERYHTLVSHIPQKIFYKDCSSVYISCNDLYARDFGIPAFDIIGKTDFEFFPGELAEKYRADDRSIMEQGCTVEIEENYIEHGELRTVFTVKTPVRNERGEVIGLVGIFSDITDRKRAEDKLKKTLLNLERSNAELVQFAYIASHDLQEPLRMVSSFVQLLAKRYAGKLDADADEFIRNAVDGTARMQEMINALLEFSRAGSSDKTFTSIDCSVVFDQTVNNLKVAIEESGALITHDKLPTVIADEVQMVQLLQNLINNSIKFTKNGPPKIHVSAAKHDSEWVFSVHDNGIGIEQQYFERVFTIFQRLHSKAEYSGSGIGLSICKKIVERHGGRIWIESQIGKGSTFYFSLPEKGV